MRQAAEAEAEVELPGRRRGGRPTTPWRRASATATREQACVAGGKRQRGGGRRCVGADGGAWGLAADGSAAGDGGTWERMGDGGAWGRRQRASSAQSSGVGARRLTEPTRMGWSPSSQTSTAQQPPAS
ncbi:Os06g0508950 [Oryza sativa Japonica Group]|uniref:Os06g0508950 protein n=1 Tax=Oryza sativa subsp. japonica TaxID=39947 RepID=A0A0N7KM67_ORYSJ|nr:Os06g0508950 [Oryza sativa Japonica Group]